MQVTICGPNLRDQSKGDIHVHVANCTDLKRGARREPEYANGWTIDAESKAQVVHEIYPPEDFNYEPEDWDEYVGSINFFPCTADLPDEVAR